MTAITTATKNGRNTFARRASQDANAVNMAGGKR
jgi:hypothetical protein